MAYSEKIVSAVGAGEPTLGNRLGRWAVHLNVPVTKIARSTGATRQTVYNWFYGGEVAPAYHKNVQCLVDIMQTATSADDAWRKICTKLHLRG